VGQPDLGNEDFGFDVEAVAIVHDTGTVELLVLGIVAENSDLEVENETFDHGTVAVEASVLDTAVVTGGLDYDRQVADVVVEPFATALDTAATVPEYNAAAVDSSAPDTVGSTDVELTAAASSPGRPGPDLLVVWPPWNSESLTSCLAQPGCCQVNVPGIHSSFPLHLHYLPHEPHFQAAVV